MYKNPLFKKTTPATDFCGKGSFLILGVSAHPLKYWNWGLFFL